MAATKRLKVISDLGGGNYPCVFRGSATIYTDAAAGISPAGITGIFDIDTATKGLPEIDTAELLRKSVLDAVSISYKEGTRLKSKKIYVASNKLTDFLDSVDAGTVSFKSIKVTSAVRSTNRFTV